MNEISENVIKYILMYYNPISKAEYDYYNNTLNSYFDRIEENRKNPEYLFKGYYNNLFNIALYNTVNNTWDINSIRILYNSFDRLNEYYNKNASVVGNWWEWRIGIPLYGTFALYLMRNAAEEFNKKRELLYFDGTTQVSDFTQAVEHFTTDFLSKGDLTYANLASACIASIASAYLKNDDTSAYIVNKTLRCSVEAYHIKNKTDFNKVRFARKLQKSAVKHPILAKLPISMFSEKEGLFDDGSFLQHTSVPYMGTYGIELLEYLVFLLFVDPEAFDAFRKLNRGLEFLVEHATNIIFDNNVMHAFTGRSAQEVDTRANAERINKLTDAAIDFLDRKESYVCYKIKNDPSKFNIVNYNNADRVIVKDKKWAAVLSMCSDRVAMYESYVDNQHLEELGTGALYIYKKGIKYNNDLYCPEGSTHIKHKKVVKSVQPLFNYDKELIDKMHAGSVLYGDCCIAGQQIGELMKKSWSFNKNYICCTVQSDKGMTTTITDQPVKKVKTYGDSIDIYYDERNKIAYSIPMSNGVVICSEGNLFIKHNDKTICVYFIYPDVDDIDKFLSSYKVPKIEITANEKAFCYLVDTDDGDIIYQLFFFEPGTIKFNRSPKDALNVTADKPCCMQIRYFNKTKGYGIFLVDYMQRFSKVNVTINRWVKPSSGMFNIVENKNSCSTITFDTKGKMGTPLFESLSLV